MYLVYYLINTNKFEEKRILIAPIHLPQNQSPEVFYKKVFFKIHRKTPVLEFLF